MSNNLKIGDLVIFNSKFSSHYPFPVDGTGIVTKNTTMWGNTPRYDILFPIGKLFDVPRHWFIKVNTAEPQVYCPIEEEWKMWGDT